MRSTLPRPTALMGCFVGVVLCSACGRLNFSTLAVDDAGGPALDAPFSGATLLSALSTDDLEDDPTLSADMLEIYFNRSARPDLDAQDILRATRMTIEAAWSAPIVVDPLSDPAQQESNPELTPDGARLFLGRRASVASDWVLLAFQRASGTAAWRGPEAVSSLETPDGELSLDLDGAAVDGVLQRITGTAAADLYAIRAVAADSFTDVRALTELNTDILEESPFLTADGLVLYFTRAATPQGDHTLMVARRAAVDATFEAPVPVDVDGLVDVQDPCLS